MKARAFDAATGLLIAQSLGSIGRQLLGPARGALYVDSRLCLDVATALRHIHVQHPSAVVFLQLVRDHQRLVRTDF